MVVVVVTVEVALDVIDLMQHCVASRLDVWRLAQHALHRTPLSKHRLERRVEECETLVSRRVRGLIQKRDWLDTI